MPATLTPPSKPASASTAPKPASTAPTPTPQPKPSAPAPKTPETPTPPVSSPTDGVFGDAFSQLDDIDKGMTAADASTKAKAKASKASESAPAELALDVEKAESPTTTESQTDAGSATTATEATADKPVKAAELRAAYTATKQKVKEYETKVAELTAKVKEYESKPQEDPKPLLEKLSALEKENNEFREELKFTNYVKSPEFAEKYQKPYNDAWAKAVREIEQLTITTEDGSARQATPNDILALANAPLSALDEQAEAMFGKSAARVIRHVERIRDLAEAQEKAISDAKTSGAEREKAFKVQEEQRRSRIGSLIANTNKQLAEKYPKWFGHEPTDTEGNTVFDKGLEYVDAAFNHSSPLNEDQRISRMVVIRNKAANHDRLALHVKRLNTELSELRDTLKQYEQSEPDTGKGAAAASAPKSGNWLDQAEAEIQALDRK